jgi:uncharacterized membrane protein YbhN (UPF0104 family)
MKTQVRNRLSRSAQIAVTALCFLYLFHDLDIRAVSAALQAFPPGLLALALPLSALSLLPSCLRLHSLCAGRSDALTAAKALFFGYGVNNLLPAKLGELAKAAYLSRAKGLPAQVSLCAVFWERLADLNIVLFFSVVVGLWYGMPELYLPLLTGMALIWTALFFLFRFPSAFMRVPRALPAGWPRELAGAIIERLGDAEKRPNPLVLLLYSFAVWLSFILFTYWFFASVCGRDPGVAGATLICIAGGVGMILPSMPASLGAYEAGVTAALTVLGIMDKESALSAALLLHLVGIVPPALFIGYSALVEKIPLPGGRRIFPEDGPDAARPNPDCERPLP